MITRGWTNPDISFSRCLAMAILLGFINDFVFVLFNNIIFTIVDLIIPILIPGAGTLP